MQAIILQIVGLLIVLTLLIMFFSKPNVENKETKTYSKLLILNFIFISIGIMTYFVAHSTGNYTYIGILQKAYMSVLALLNMYSMFYCISIHDKNNKYQTLKNILFVITIISILLITFLPLNVIYEGDLLDGNGPSYDVAISHTILSFCFFIIVTIYFLIKKYSIKKILPYIILIILYLSGFFVRTFYKELIFEGFYYSYILFIMFSTIENPDIKMAKELSFQKELTLDSSKKTLELIEEMSNELKSTVKELEIIGNTKIDKNNMNEINNLLANFQDKAILLSDRISGILDLALVKSDTKHVSCKYETCDMLDRLKQLLMTEKNNHTTKLKIEIANDIPKVLYGDEEKNIKAVLFLFDFLSSIIENKNMKLEINSIKVGNFSKIRFNFITNDKAVQKYIVEDRYTKTLRISTYKNVKYEILKNLLARLNGTLIITKNEKSIIFSININQRVASEYDVISNKKENKNVKIGYKNFSGKRILIVDNNNLKLKELKVLLMPYNVEVETAHNLSEMCNSLNENKTFDLVFIDDIIPGNKISDFSKEVNKDDNILYYLKRETKYPIATIVMTTQNSQNYEKKYLKLGFTDYIQKPINKKNLDDILNKYFIA